jgi:hypothetical protein
MPPPKKRKLDKEGIQSSEKPSHDEDDVSMNVVDEDGQGAMSVESHSQSQSRSGGSEREASEELQGSRNPDPDEDSDSEMNSSTDTDEEIALSKMKKSKKTAKRKIRATSPTQFGSTLEALLGTSAPSAAPLALKSGMHRRMKNDRKDVKAKRELESQRKEHEEVGRVTDVIGGWGGENERALRKVAQRGGKPLLSRWFPISDRVADSRSTIQCYYKSTSSKGKRREL